MCILEIKSVQVCESVQHRYERRILKIVGFDLNIREGKGEGLAIIYPHVPHPM